MARKKLASESICTNSREDAEEDKLNETGYASPCMKDISVGADCTASGRLFQSLGPSFAKDPSK